MRSFRDYILNESICDISNPMSWPFYPVLPIRNKSNGQLGVIFADNSFNVLPTVFLANITDISGSIRSIIDNPMIKRINYQNVAGICREWGVD